MVRYHLLVKSSSPKGRYLNPVSSCKNQLAFTSRKTRCFRCSAFATQALPCGSLIHISGCNFPIRSGRKNTEKGNLLKNSMKVKEPQAGFWNGNASLWPLGWGTKEGFCSRKVVTWLLEMESLTMLSVCKKDLLKNNIPFKWCSTFALSRVQIENTLSYRNSALPSPGLEIQNNQVDCWMWEDGEEWKHVVYWAKSFPAVDCHWNTHQSKLKHSSK